MKKVINIALKSEMSQLFKDKIFFLQGSLITEGVIINREAFVRFTIIS